MKTTAKETFGDARFQLHKWHSNAKAIEAENTTKIEEDQTCAKQQLGVKKGETKILGLPWDKNRDSIQITVRNEATENAVRNEAEENTKRGILGKLAKIYDPLGLVSPLTLTGKTLYREACDLKIA